jgi:hypothetical protein
MFFFGEAPKMTVMMMPRYPEEIEGDLSDDDFKVMMIPITKGKILIRVENILDSFPDPDTQRYFDLDKFMTYVYAQANHGAAFPGADYSEMSLTANQLYDEMRANKWQWKTISDEMTKNGKRLFTKLDDGNSMMLEGQRMRTFLVTLKEKAQKKEIKKDWKEGMKKDFHN